MNKKSDFDDNNYVVSIKSLSRQFGNKKALNDINLNVKKGQVFGIIGQNGAGKTTTIKHILGLYKAQQGQVSVFGYDPSKQPAEVLSKIGYLSEEPDLPAWMTVKELLNYMSAFYPKWDENYANELLDKFGLDKEKKIRELSKGQKAKAGLCMAQAHHPELLILDEPSSGLDPIVRRDILKAIIRTVVNEGGTVIFSSHLLEEVERFSDHLIMLHQGEVLFSDTMKNIINGHHKIVIGTDCSHTTLLSLPSVFNIENNNGVSEISYFDDLEEIKSELSQLNISIISCRPMTLDEIFVARSQQQNQIRKMS